MGPKAGNSIQAKVGPAAAIGIALRHVFPHAGDGSAFADLLAALDALPGVTDAAAIAREAERRGAA